MRSTFQWRRVLESIGCGFLLPFLGLTTIFHRLVAADCSIVKYYLSSGGKLLSSIIYPARGEWRGKEEYSRFYLLVRLPDWEPSTGPGIRKLCLDSKFESGCTNLSWSLVHLCTFLYIGPIVWSSVQLFICRDSHCPRVGQKLKGFPTCELDGHPDPSPPSMVSPLPGCPLRIMDKVFVWYLGTKITNAG